MPLETLEDTRAMIDTGEFARRFYIGAGVYADGIMDNNFDQSLDTNGRRTGIRFVSAYVTTAAVGSSITDVNAEIGYIIRERETGARTTLLILERT